MLTGKRHKSEVSRSLYGYGYSALMSGAEPAFATGMNFSIVTHKTT
jgi:hypothetical protein